MHWLWRLTIGTILAAGLAACVAVDRQDRDASMRGKTVYIVHGYRAGPQDHWFEWLAAKIRASGGDARILAMPDSSDPDPKAWNRTLRRDIPQLDENTYIVAHSLGTLATLRFLGGQEENARIGGLLLVSPFAAPLPDIPELDGFIARSDFIPARIIDVAGRRDVVLSTSDPLVRPELSRALATSIDAPVTQVPDAGHFLGSDGYDSFPRAWALLEAQAAAR